MTPSQKIMWEHVARLRVADGSGRTIRIRAGLSMAEIAQAAGAHEATISRWENGLNIPRRSVAAARWAELLAELERALGPVAA